MSAPRTRRYVPAVGPRLKALLVVVLVLFSLISINGLYLVSVTIAQWVTKQTIENLFYQYMFAAHLALGILLTIPFLVFGALHLRNARKRPNRLAVRAGYGLFTAGLVVILSGFALTRSIVDLRQPTARSIVYWFHVIAPLVVVWLFVLHRLAGKPIRWKVGLRLGTVGAAFAIFMVLMHSEDPKLWNMKGPASGEQYFFPALSRTNTGNFIPARALMMDDYCKRCHEDVHKGWEYSAHRFSSFNNPVYLMSVRNTRKAMLERDGNVQGARFCAGCHDPVPFFSGAFDDPNFDDVNHPTAQAGLTCSVCHAITNVDDARGNGSYTIEEPSHYPFAYSENPFLQWVNEQLVKAKPAFHKKTFLKPFHKTAEFCATCHKVHLPEELNQYKWLRGQNHYDSFLLSGVSGHGVSSFYYPPKAQENCNGCHMKPIESEDFGARSISGTGKLEIHDHHFPSANTGIPHILDFPSWVNEAHEKFHEGNLRVDLFGVKSDGRIDGELTAPIRPEVPVLEPGRRYLFEVLIRTLKVGHHFTQGTGDSNDVWLDVTVKAGDRVVGRSGGLDDGGDVDPWSYFVNVYLLDRHGKRIDRRNPEDIFIPLYNHQIPPGAASIVHYGLEVPEGLTEPLTFEVKLLYRKFDTRLMRHVYGQDWKNDLPITVLAADRVTFPVAGVAATIENPPRDIAEWERWNDYGIGLLLEGDSGSRKGELRQAEEAFARVEELGRPDGPLNRARVYVKEGRLAEAVVALKKAASHDPPAPPWTVEWFTGLVNKENNHLDDAIQNFTNLIETRYPDAVERGFDFSYDYRVLNELAATLHERSKRERGAAGRELRESFLAQAVRHYSRVLELDPENAPAHYGLSQIYRELGDLENAEKHAKLHRKYKPDDTARRVTALHRAANPAADHAAESIVIYDLQRPGAFGLDPEFGRVPKAASE